MLISVHSLHLTAWKWTHYRQTVWIANGNTHKPPLENGLSAWDRSGQWRVTYDHQSANGLSFPEYGFTFLSAVVWLMATDVIQEMCGNSWQLVNICKKFYHWSCYHYVFQITLTSDADWTALDRTVMKIPVSCFGQWSKTVQHLHSRFLAYKRIPVFLHMLFLRKKVFVWNICIILEMLMDRTWTGPAIIPDHLTLDWTKTRPPF